jgi:hypothetical protein
MAAARQKEMNDNITVVATTTLVLADIGEDVDEVRGIKGEYRVFGHSDNYLTA